MDNEIRQSLEKIGLKEREVRVYLATLSLGESTVLPIARDSGIKRTYCYDILEDLKKADLVSYFEKNGRRRYIASHPDKIKDFLKGRLSELDGIMPQLRSIYNNSVEKPKIRYFEGKEGIISIYEDVLHSQVKQIDAIASPGDINSSVGDYFLGYASKLIKRKVKIREIITKDGQYAEYLGYFKKPLQESRILPDGIAITTDMMIYGNKLVLVSYGKSTHAVSIESSSIVETHRKLFDITWGSSVPLKN